MPVPCDTALIGTLSGGIGANNNPTIVEILHQNTTKISVGSIPIPLTIVERRVSIKAHKVTHTVPLPFVLEEFGNIEFVFGKVVEFFAQLIINTARVQSCETR